jgi:hypothetical protein
MPRTARASIGGICYHVLNRGYARQDVFHEDDYRSPHGPGIQAATPRKPTNRGKTVECPLFASLPVRNIIDPAKRGEAGPTKMPVATKSLSFSRLDCLFCSARHPGDCFDQQNCVSQRTSKFASRVRVRLIRSLARLSLLRKHMRVFGKGVQVHWAWGQQCASMPRAFD